MDTTNFRSAGAGEIIHPDLARPTHDPLPLGQQIKCQVVEIFHENPEHPPKASENFEVRVKYPNGVVKGHQIAKGADTAHLITRVRNQLRGMHGGEKNGNLSTQLPAKIEGLTVGTILTFEGDQ